MLKYSLTENLLTDRPDDWSAQTHAVGSLDKEAVITRMLNRGTLLTRTDIVAVLNALEETATEAVSEGYTLNLPLLNTSFSISGVFDGPLDTFDGNRHRLHVNLAKSSVLREAENSVKLEKTNAVAPMPQIQEVKDSVSGALNEELTPGGVIEVRGHNLKIEGIDPAVGLWFVNGNGEEIKAEVMIENKPSRIIAMIPSLSIGQTYHLKLATQYAGGGKLLKTPRVFTYSKPLSVLGGI